MVVTRLGALSRYAPAAADLLESQIGGYELPRLQRLLRLPRIDGLVALQGEAVVGAVLGQHLDEAEGDLAGYAPFGEGALAVLRAHPGQVGSVIGLAVAPGARGQGIGGGLVGGLLAHQLRRGCRYFCAISWESAAPLAQRSELLLTHSGLRLLGRAPMAMLLSRRCPRCGPACACSAALYGRPGGWRDFVLWKAQRWLSRRSSR